MKIIINADDFGLTETSTLAILDAFNKGYISSTTMCANGDYFDEALELAKENNLNKKIGIHINLTEGKPLTREISQDSLFCHNGKFHGEINRYRPLSRKQKKEVYDEVKAQIERIKKSGLNITHADSHHHIHTSIFITPTILKVLKRYDIKKIRMHRNIGDISIIKKIIKKSFNLWLRSNTFTTADYFGSIDDCIVDSIANKSGILEIMVHPDYNEKGQLIDNVEYDGNAGGEELQRALQVTNERKLSSYFEI